mgnify:CR=1 FL=1
MNMFSPLIDYFYVQAEAILDLKLYKLAKLEIWTIKDELKEKQAEAARIMNILSSDRNLWEVIREELLELRKLYGQPRRSKIGGVEAQISITDEAAYIIDEQTYVLVSKEGWIKRQGSFKTIEKIRVRDKDKITFICKTRTKETIGFFTNHGTCYTMRIADIPATTGYGEPIQKHFSLSDGEKIVSSIVFSEKTLPLIDPETNCVPFGKDDSEYSLPIIEDNEHPPPYGVALSKAGRSVRFSLTPYREPTNKNGRRFMRIDIKSKGNKDTNSADGVLAVYPIHPQEWISLYTKTRVLCFPAIEISLIRNAAKGVTAIKLDSNDEIQGFEMSRSLKEGIMVSTQRGRNICVSPKRFGGKRAARGKQMLKRGALSSWSRPLIRQDKIWQNQTSSEMSSEISSIELSSTVSLSIRRQKEADSAEESETSTEFTTAEAVPSILEVSNAAKKTSRKKHQAKQNPSLNKKATTHPKSRQKVNSKKINTSQKSIQKSFSKETPQALKKEIQTPQPSKDTGIKQDTDTIPLFPELF